MELCSVPGQKAGAGRGNPRLSLHPGGLKIKGEKNFFFGNNTKICSAFASYFRCTRLVNNISIDELVDCEQRLRPALVRVPGPHLHGHGATPGDGSQVINAARMDEKNKTEEKHHCNITGEEKKKQNTSGF